jgi:hypothetical protein
MNGKVILIDYCVSTVPRVATAHYVSSTLCVSTAP